MPIESETISNPTLITLRSGIDPLAITGLRRLPGVDVVTGAPESVLIVAGDVIALDVRVVTSDELKPLFDNGDKAREHGLLLLVKAVLDDAMAAQIEDAGFGYVDAAQRAWLPGQPKTVRARNSRQGERHRMRAPSIRLAQLLADYPDEAWTERSLAARGQSTQVTAHGLLTQLEQARLVVREGSGRTTKRRVRHISALRQWLSKQARPSRARRLLCYVEDPIAAASYVGGHTLVLTGAVAAERIGYPVFTEAQQRVYRVDVQDDDALEQMPEELGGFRVERGANLILIADPGRLAITDARKDTSGHLIAPPSRVMLDLFLESRGEAAAQVFLDLWGEMK